MVQEPADSPHAAQRLARCMVAVVGSSRDPRTFSMWAREAGVSPTQLRGYCRLVALGPKHCLDFSRLLRVAMHRSSSGYSLENLLDISDTRTIRSLMRRAGVTLAQFPTDGNTYVQKQALIKDPVLLAQVRLQLTLLENATAPCEAGCTGPTPDR